MSLQIISEELAPKAQARIFFFTALENGTESPEAKLPNGRNGYQTILLEQHQFATRKLDSG
jgi:hypothetical protein